MTINILPPYSHVAFADESNWNQGRFRSISLVSAALSDARIIHRKMDALRQHHRQEEFKWNGISRRQGLALADIFFNHCRQMCVDVLVWDIHDSRYGDVRHRDDIANFARMYYHLLHNVLKYRWPNDARWLICPDENKQVDWVTLESYLDWKGWAREYDLFSPTREKACLCDLYNIHEMRCGCSKEYALIQLADMFAGLAAYSYTSYDKYIQWMFEQESTPCFPDWPAKDLETLKISSNDRERFPILRHVRQEAKKRKFQVSFESGNGLRTMNPQAPLNFWLYETQHAKDKAPVKSKT